MFNEHLNKNEHKTSINTNKDIQQAEKISWGDIVNVCLHKWD